MEQDLSGNDKSRTALFMLLSFPLGRGPRVHCPMVEMIYLLSAPIESSPWFLMCSVDSKAGLSCSVLVLVSNAHHHPHFNSNKMVSDSHDTVAPMSCWRNIIWSIQAIASYSSFCRKKTEAQGRWGNILKFIYIVKWWNSVSNPSMSDSKSLSMTPPSLSNKDNEWPALNRVQP